MKSKKITMQAIADQLDVSKVTVYKALNNQKYVSEELRERIVNTANKMGYVAPIKISQSRTNRLAFITPKRFFLKDESFYTTIFYHLNNACLNDEILLTLFVVNNIEEENCTLPNTLSQGNFDGVFIAGEMKDDYIKCIGNLSLPILLIDFYKPNFNYDCVIADNFFNGFSATNYLIERGHTEIGFVGSLKQTTSISDRFFGYQKALVNHGLTFNPDWHLINYNPVTGIYDLDTPLPGNLPTAFVCHCDKAAYFIIQRLNMENIKVPKDISIISFDNTDLAASSSPALTTIDISTKDIAKKSYAQLQARIEDNTIPKQRIYIPCNIIERDSTKSLI
ncbi:MAG: LacI family DNA-binding transcriptional regulator [Mobilitalea sp.]